MAHFYYTLTSGVTVVNGFEESQTNLIQAIMRDSRNKIMIFPYVSNYSVDNKGEEVNTQLPV